MLVRLISAKVFKSVQLILEAVPLIRDNFMGKLSAPNAPVLSLIPASFNSFAAKQLILKTAVEAYCEMIMQ